MERAIMEYKDKPSPRCLIMNPETGEAVKSYRFPTDPSSMSWTAIKSWREMY